MEDAKVIIKGLRAYKTEATDIIKPYKQRLDEVKKQVLTVEKGLVSQCDEGEGILKQKINARLDYLEGERIKEEARLRELAEKDRQKRMESINKKLDGLLDKASDYTEQKQILEAQLEDPEMTVEEAEIIRQKINKIEFLLGNVQGRVEEKTLEVENVASPVNIVVDNKPDVKGLSSSKVWEPVQVMSAALLLRAILEGRAPASCVKFDMVAIKRFANDQVKGTNSTPNVPGVQFREVRDTRIR